MYGTGAPWITAARRLILQINGLVKGLKGQTADICLRSRRAIHRRLDVLVSCNLSLELWQKEKAAGATPPTCEMKRSPIAYMSGAS